MKRIGFSTGAIAKGDFAAALDQLRCSSADAVELSALRVDELWTLLDHVERYDFHQFKYVSVHAPADFGAEEESRVVAALESVAAKGWNIVVHPDSMHDVNLWSSLGEFVCIENMDKRKKTGRTASELSEYFARLPRACLCFDIAHARQFDSSMTEAYKILKQFSSKIRQVHVSEVTTASKHVPMSEAAAEDFRHVAEFIPEEAIFIIEGSSGSGELDDEIKDVQETFARSAKTWPNSEDRS